MPPLHRLPPVPGACRLRWLMLSLALGLLGLRAADPAPPPRLRDLAVALDPTGHATVAEVADPAVTHPGRFRPIGQTYNGGMTRHATWLRFTVDTPGGDWWLVLLPPILDDVRLYEPDGGTWREHRAGDTLPFSIREFPYRGFAFQLHSPGAGPRTCYLRLQSTSAIWVLPRVLTGAELHRTTLVEYVLLLGLIGCLVLMATLNTFTYVTARDPLHGWFIIALLVQAALYLTNSGFTAEFLLPDHPAITDVGVSVGTAIGYSAFAAFYLELLQIRRQQRLTYLLYRSLQWGALLIPLGLPLGWFPRSLQAIQLLFAACVLAAIAHGYQLWRQAVPGRALVAGVIAFNMGALAISSLLIAGVMPVSLFSLHSAQISSFGTIALAHLAITLRYDAVRLDLARSDESFCREHELRLQTEKFVDLVSHEYRTPLTVLKLSLHLLEKSTGEQPRQKIVGRMRQAVERLSDVFNSTLGRDGAWGDLRRIESTPIDLSTFLPAVLAKLAAAPGEATAAADLQLTSPALVLADRLLLETVLTNLLENARKYGTPRTRIRVAAAPRGERTEISVTNHYAPDVTLPGDRLFERAVRGPNATGHAGSGLGLYLVRKLTEDQKGSVSLDLTQPGRFHLVLNFPTPAHPPA